MLFLLDAYDLNFRNKSNSLKYFSEILNILFSWLVHIVGYFAAVKFIFDPFSFYLWSIIQSVYEPDLCMYEPESISLESGSNGTNNWSQWPNLITKIVEFMYLI